MLSLLSMFTYTELKKKVQGFYFVKEDKGGINHK